jgi:hypothetical protein
MIRRLLKTKRKNRYTTFPSGANRWTSLLLLVLFIIGFIVSLRLGAAGTISYLGLWAISYIVIYIGTCRNCVYYGRKCSVPLEGSCVHLFFKKGKNKFGYSSLFWAALSYVMRIFLPTALIVHHRLFVTGAVYFSIFVLFWIVHLRITGCPNCINYRCPLNPDYGLEE